MHSVPSRLALTDIIQLGDFGTLSKQTGEFLKDGSIFSHPATKEHAAKFTIKGGATDGIQEYISIEASRLHFESGPEMYVYPFCLYIGVI